MQVTAHVHDRGLGGDAHEAGEQERGAGLDEGCRDDSEREGAEHGRILPVDHVVDQVLAGSRQDESGEPDDDDEDEAGRQPPAMDPQELPSVAQSSA